MAELSPTQLSVTEEFISNFNGRIQYFAIKDSEPLRAYPMSAARALPALDKDSKDGFNIYYTVSMCKPGDKRRKVDFIHSRAVFIDDDGPDKDGGSVDPSRFPIPPNITVSTSPGKFHYYWLTNTSNGDEYEAVQYGMAKTYNGDVAVQDRTRVMRLPGYVHHGSGKMVTFIKHHSKVYAWEEILEHFPPLHKEVKLDKPDWKPALDIEDNLKKIITGESIYPSCMPLAFSLINRGMVPTLVKTVLSGILGGLEVGASPELLLRIEKCRAEMDNFIYDAVGKRNKELSKQYIEDESIGSMYTTLDWPCGKVGQVAKWINSIMTYPAPAIAIPAAFHVVSLMGGGCYHYQGVSVSRVRTILADNGRGKQTASNATLAIIDSLKIPGLSDMFVMSEAHSPFNYQAAMNKHKVRGMVNSEAGLLMSSGAGDQKNKSAWKLNVLGLKIGDAPIRVVELSRGNSKNLVVDAVNPVYDPIFILLDESTPQTYLPAALKEMHTDSGWLARSELFFVPPEEEYNHSFYENRTIPPWIIELFTAMVGQFNEAGVGDGSTRNCSEKMIECDFSQVMDAMAGLILKDVRLRKESHGDSLKRATVTRYLEKLKTTMIILAIADSCDVNRVGPLAPVVTMEHFKYAEAYHDEINRALLANSKIGHMASPIDQALEKLKNNLRLAGGELDSDRHRLGKNGAITHDWLTRKFRAGDGVMVQLEARNYNNPKKARLSLMEEAEGLGLVTNAGKDIWVNNLKR